VAEGDDLKMAMNDDMTLLIVHFSIIIPNLYLNFADYQMKMMEEKNENHHYH
jgi:hypothetical protein